MMNRLRLGSLSLSLFAAVATVGAAQQALPPVRQLGPVAHVAPEIFGAVSAVRQLANGNVVVNDIIGRRVLLLDSALNVVTVIADTTSATANAYGTRPGGLIAYRGDSTLFVDPASLSMLLIDPNGKIARVMSAPRANDVGFLIGGPFGTPGFDAQGKLVYRAPPQFRFNGPPSGGNGLPQMPQIPDSAALIRVDLATRKVDTITYFRTPKVNVNMTRSPDGGVRVSAVVNPLSQGDDWAILPDGTIALVRTKDFHIDWIGADGKIVPSAKIPFQWERLTDSGKVAFLDSARIAIEKARASGQLGFGGLGGGGQQAVFRGDGAGAGAGGGGGGGRAGRRAASEGATAAASPPAGTGPAQTTTTTANGNTTVTVGGAGGAAGVQLPPFTLVDPSELPDYRPAFSPGATRADADGNLWIRTSQNVDARPVYNVVNRKGELIDRVQLPLNRALIGFGAGGLVYLGVRDGRTARLEVARVR